MSDKHFKISLILNRWVTDLWYGKSMLSRLLIPLSWIFYGCVRLRRALYETGLLKSVKLPVPVIVVGNITVGGTGKTPLIIWLADYLRQRGYRPGIISRGYGGRAGQWPQPVNQDSDPKRVGDEALLLARYSACPVVVGSSRVASAHMLLAKTDCNVILSDDGLQHYALQRDIEIAVIDGHRRFGNGALLPAGPLREPIGRLQRVDARVCNDGQPQTNEFAMQMAATAAINLATGEQRRLDRFSSQSCHALAGIGNPERFFATLEKQGVLCDTAMFPDHYPYRRQDIDYNDNRPVLMTEKDAVKCTKFADARHWYVPVRAQVPEALGRRLLQLLDTMVADPNPT